MRRICVMGTGYVGLVTGACLSDFGNAVVCLDIDEEKVARLLTLPEGHVIINVISFGYPSEDEPGRPSRPRAGFDEYVHWEHW